MQICSTVTDNGNDRPTSIQGDNSQSATEDTTQDEEDNNNNCVGFDIVPLATSAALATHRGQKEEVGRQRDCGHFVYCTQRNRSEGV